MAKKVEEQVDLNEELETELAQYNFGDMLELAENITDMSVECTPTGFPQLDKILHASLNGLPHGRDIEIFSKEPEVGKAIGKSCRIKTLDGWVKAEDIKLHDTIASVDGLPSTIEGIYPQGFRRMYKITFSDGRTAKSDGEHLWEIHRNHQSQDVDQYELRTTYEIMELLESKSNRGKISIRTCSGDFGNSRSLPLDAMLLGILLGDGGLTDNTPVLTTADEDILSYVSETSQRYNCHVSHYSKYSYGISGDVHGTNQITNILKELGVYGKDAYDKFIPKIYQDAPKVERLRLLGGLINTDGTVGKNGIVSFSTVSLQLARDVQELVWSLGGISRINGPYKKMYTYAGRKLEGAPAYIVSVIMKNIGDVPIMPRKYERLNIEKKQTPRLSFVSIEPDGIDEAICFKVSHPSHLYIIENYVVTHNTSLGLQILQHWQSLGKRTLIIDVERTITIEFLAQLGIVTTPGNPGVIPVRVSRPPDAFTAEQVLDLVRDASKVFDLVVVDSIAAMDIKANLEKDSDESAKIGAIALLMSNFLRKNVAKRATVIWINQTRQVVGGYNPTGQIRYQTMGGRALPFFGTIRLDISIIEKLKKEEDGEENVYALKTKVYTMKNKVSPPYKQAILTYVLGEGFSVHYDYFELGLKLGIIAKKGGWYQFQDFKVQGDLNFYKSMKKNEELFTGIKKAISEELASHGAAGITEG